MEKREASSQPYVIKIKNLTNEKIEDIKLIDFDYKEQSKVEYSCFKDFNYDMMLRSIQSRSENDFVDIEKILCTVKSDFFREQSDSILTICARLPNNSACWISRPLLTNENNSVLQCDEKFKLFVNVDLILQYLMPKTEIEFFLYPVMRIPLTLQHLEKRMKQKKENVSKKK